MLPILSRSKADLLSATAGLYNHRPGDKIDHFTKHTPLPRWFQLRHLIWSWGAVAICAYIAFSVWHVPTIHIAAAPPATLSAAQSADPKSLAQ